MTDTPNTPTAPAPLETAAYPLMAYNYRVDVAGVTMAFSEVSGLKRHFDHVTYRHGFSYVQGEQISKYYIDKYEAVTMKRGTVKGLTGLVSWLESDSPKAVEIRLCDEQGAAAVTWKIAKALPVKLDAPTFDASTNEVAIVSLELMAAGITITHH